MLEEVGYEAADVKQGKIVISAGVRQTEVAGHRRRRGLEQIHFVATRSLDSTRNRSRSPRQGPFAAKRQSVNFCCNLGA